MLLCSGEQTHQAFVVGRHVISPGRHITIMFTCRHHRDYIGLSRRCPSADSDDGRNAYCGYSAALRCCGYGRTSVHPQTTVSGAPEGQEMLDGLHDDPVALTQRLVRFDTTNPPGEEAECVEFVAGLAAEGGLDTKLITAEPGRPSLLARLPGRGAAPALLLHAHADVVPTAGQRWSHPPFDGEIRDGHVWGRGSIDMKGGMAMMLTAMLGACAQGTDPAGDVVLAVVPDEEAGSAAGAGRLVRESPELFDGIRYAVGEDGGADLELDGRTRLPPVVVAEKRACWLRVTLRGPGGHASRVAGADSAVRLLTRLLATIESGGLPPQVVPAVDRMLAELAAALSGPLAEAFERLRTDPSDEDTLGRLSPADAQYLRS